MEEEINKEVLELVELLTPGPLGEGLSYKQAAKVLGISTRTVKRRMAFFKTTYPEAFGRFESMCNSAQAEMKSLGKPYNVGNSFEYFEETAKKRW